MGVAALKLVVLCNSYNTLSSTLWHLDFAHEYDAIVVEITKCTETTIASYECAKNAMKYLIRVLYTL